MKEGYQNPLCVKCNNDVCKVYGGRCRKYRIIYFFKRLFCKHNYKKIAWQEEYDQIYNERYAERLYECSKCSKRIWVDGRCDPYFGKE